MIKKSITYEDFDGNSRTEDFYFSLNQAELIEMEMSAEGGMEAMIKKLIRTSDTKRIYELFRTIILKSYGEKSPDGRRFVKSEELSKDFEQTNAFSELVIDLMSGENSASDFINGLIPNKLAQKMEEMNNKAVAIQ